LDDRPCDLAHRPRRAAVLRLPYHDPGSPVRMTSWSRWKGTVASFGPAVL